MKCRREGKNIPSSKIRRVPPTFQRSEVKKCISSSPTWRKCSSVLLQILEELNESKEFLQPEYVILESHFSPSRITVPSTRVMLCRRDFSPITKMPCLNPVKTVLSAMGKLPARSYSQSSHGRCPRYHDMGAIALCRRTPDNGGVNGVHAT